jgi:hypothetical protein
VNGSADHAGEGDGRGRGAGGSRRDKSDSVREVAAHIKDNDF